MKPPMTSQDCDLRDFQFMPMDIGRLFGSRFHAIANDAEWRAGVTLWLKSFHQVPAASLPDDDVELCRLAELGRDTKAWKKIRENALHGWEKCADGRLYHSVVAEKAMEAWGKKQSYRERSKKGNSKRWGQQKDDQMQSFSDPSGINNGVLESPKGQGQGQGQGQKEKSEAAAPDKTGVSDALFVQPQESRRTSRMTADWQPPETFKASAVRAGVDVSLLTDAVLDKFRNHYAEGQECTTGQWVNRLIDWLKREKPIQAHQPQTAAQPAVSDGLSWMERRRFVPVDLGPNANPEHLAKLREQLK